MESSCTTTRNGESSNKLIKSSSSSCLRKQLKSTSTTAAATPSSTSTAKCKPSSLPASKFNGTCRAMSIPPIPFASFMRFVVVFLSLSGLHFTGVDATTAFLVNQAPKCQNGLNLVIEYLTCDGVKNHCEFGTNVYLTGKMTINNPNLTRKVFMKNKACLFGFNGANKFTSMLMCREYAFEMDFCSFFGISYAGCPARGMYLVDAQFSLPEQTGLSFGKKWWLTIESQIYAIKDANQQEQEQQQQQEVASGNGFEYYAYPDDDTIIPDSYQTEPIDVCTLRVDAVKTNYESASDSKQSRWQQSGTWLIGLSCLAVVGVGAEFASRRTSCGKKCGRRGQGEEADGDESFDLQRIEDDEKSATGNFEMMWESIQIVPAPRES